jgi:ATP-dependent helicase HrpB
MDGRRRCVLDSGSAVGDTTAFVAVDVREVEASRAEGGGVHTVLSLATEVDPAWVPELFPRRVAETTGLVWDGEERAVLEETALRFGGLALRRQRRPPTDPVAASQVLVDRVVAGELRLQRWDDVVDGWLARVRCVAGWFPERGLLTYDDDECAVVIAEIVGHAWRWSAVRQAPCIDHVRNALSWADQQFVEKMAPEKIRLPAGYGMRIQYAPGEPPRGRARIQDFYGLTETPRIASGRVGLLLEILAPNQRPAQVTDDLAGFWERTYPELKKELSRRYPKHEWR